MQNRWETLVCAWRLPPKIRNLNKNLFSVRDMRKLNHLLISLRIIFNTWCLYWHVKNPLTVKKVEEATNWVWMRQVRSISHSWLPRTFSFQDLEICMSSQAIGNHWAEEANHYSDPRFFSNLWKKSRKLHSKSKQHVLFKDTLTHKVTRYFLLSVLCPGSKI